MRNGLRHAATFSLALALSLGSPSPADANPSGTPGDLTGDQVIDIVDIQCSIITALWELSDGGDESTPTCLAAPVDSADLNCSGGTNVSDILLCIQLALGQQLPEEFDTDGDGALDACEPGCSACEPGETCVEMDNVLCQSEDGCADEPACLAAVSALDPACTADQWDTYCMDCAAGEEGYEGLNCSGVVAACTEHTAGCQTILDLRVHLADSSLPAIDASDLTDSTLALYMNFINQVFWPAGVHWQVESLVPHPFDDETYQTLFAQKKSSNALKQAVQTDLMAAPNGWDMFVIYQMAQFGFGGVYTCTVDGTSGVGAVWNPMVAGSGKAQHKRKWAHELGHAMGLPHTPCEPEYSHNLMMSGNCGELAAAGRIELNDTQIARIQEQVIVGGPMDCDSKDPTIY